MADLDLVEVFVVAAEGMDIVSVGLWRDHADMLRFSSLDLTASGYVRSSSL